MLSESQNSRSITPSAEHLLLAGLTVAILAFDLLLLTPTIATGGTEPLRQGLATLALIAVPAVLIVGIVRGTVRPLVAVLAIPLVAVYSYTGLLLPWTQFSFWLGQATIELLLSIPLLGGPLARAFFGGFTLSQSSLRIAFALHYASLGIALLAVLVAGGRELWMRWDAVETS